MKLQRVLALTKKELIKTYRMPAVLFMIFLFPVVFVFAFGAAFGGAGGGQASLPSGRGQYGSRTNSPIVPVIH